MASEYWNQWWRRPASRRRFLGTGAAIGVGTAGLALVGCGDDDDDDDDDTSPTATTSSGGGSPTAAPTDAPDDAAKVGGTLRLPLEGFSSGDPPTLFPFENLTYLAQTPSSLHYGRLLGEVAAADVNSSDFTVLEGDTADDWEQVDELTYTFHVRDNLVWHDLEPMNGRAATAEDFAQTYEAFSTLSQNAAAYQAVIERVEATDTQNLTVTLKDVFAPFLTTHASSPEGVWFIPVEIITSGQVQTQPVGTGPWIFKEWETGVAMRWDRNPTYWDSPRPYFEHVEGSMQRDPQRILAALQAGEFDMSGLSGTVYNEAHEALDPAGKELFAPTGVLGSYIFNFDDDGGIWHDKRMRQALSMSFSRDDLLEVLDQTGNGTWQSTLSPAMAPYFLDPSDSANFGPNAKFYEKHLDEAKALLMAATGSDTYNMTVTSNVDRYGQAAQQAWELIAALVKEGGFNTEIIYQEYGAYIQSAYLGKAPKGIALGPLIGSPRDPNDIYSRLLESTSPRHNWSGTPIDEQADIDADIAKQRTILDIEERVEFIQEMQRKMAESLLIVSYHGGAGYGYVQPWVQDYNDKIGYAVYHASMRKAYFTPERIAQG
jgi:peptide/nickel transport system substrate-binding protein